MCVRPVSKVLLLACEAVAYLQSWLLVALLYGGELYYRYKRDDDVDLTATLYLPPGYDQSRDGGLPCLMYALSISATHP